MHILYTLLETVEETVSEGSGTICITLIKLISMSNPGSYADQELLLSGLNFSGLAILTVKHCGTNGGSGWLPSATGSQA